MKESVRRVFSTIGIVGLLAFSVVTIQQVTNYCQNGGMSCFSAAVTFGVAGYQMEQFGINNDQALSTPTMAENIPSVSAFIFTLVHVTAVYLILISVIVLVLLELVELRYLRSLLKRKRA